MGPPISVSLFVVDPGMLCILQKYWNLTSVVYQWGEPKKAGKSRKKPEFAIRRKGESAVGDLNFESAGTQLVGIHLWFGEFGPKLLHFQLWTISINGKFFSTDLGNRLTNFESAKKFGISV